MDKTNELREAFALRRFKARVLRNELAKQERLERTTAQMEAYAEWAASITTGYAVSYAAADDLERLNRQVAVLSCALLTRRCWKALVADLLSPGFDDWKCDGWQAPLP